MAEVPKPRAISDSEPDTGRHEVTPVGQAALDDGEKQAADRRTSARVKETNITTSETATAVETLRLVVTQTQRDVGKLEVGLSSVSEKVDVLHERFSEVGGDVREMKGALGILVKSVDTQRERQTISFEAHVDVDKHAKIAQIDEGKEAKAFRRNAVLKVVGGIVGLLSSGAFVGYLVTSC